MLNRFLPRHLIVMSACALAVSVVFGAHAGLRGNTNAYRAPWLKAEGRRQAPDDVPAGDFLFLFATIGDSHIRSSGKTASSVVTDDRGALKALSISEDLLANYVGDINSHVPPVDFVFQLGDLTDRGMPEEFARARLILDSLLCPLYPVVGNHDNMQSDNKRAWKDFAGRELTTYAFDHSGFHFIVIDCTSDPYARPRVHCGQALREWVGRDLAANWNKPAFVVSHYNMWQRGWNAAFDTTDGYGEYGGMPELRDVLTRAGNVVAVINGHVHANRVEVHDSIFYIDVGATLIGKPSIRYFYVFPDRVEVTYAYISDLRLFKHVESLCRRCPRCFDRARVCDFIDGAESDKSFTIPIKPPRLTEP